MIKNPLLKYSVEALLFEANPSGDPFFPKTGFNKVLFLLHHKLKKRDIDLGLPYCWYRHGPLIEPVSFGDQVGTSLTNYIDPPNGIPVSIHHVHDEGVAEEEKRVVQEEIQKILGRYRNGSIWKEGYGDELVGEAYKLAPFPYQITFKRKYLKDLIALQGEPQLYEYAYEKISRTLLGHLEKLIKQFPEKEMGEVLDTYLEWDDTARLFIEIREPLDLLSTKYWEIFCSLLRVRKNENISQEIVDRWEKSFKQELPDYERKLETIHDDALQRLEQGKIHTLDKDIDPFVRCLNAYARDSVTVLPKEM